MIYAAYLRSHFSVSQPKALHSRAGGYLSEVRRATCPEESHSSFCSPFSSAEFHAASTNFSSSIVTGPDKVAHPMLKNLPRSGMDFLLHIFNLSWSSHSFPSIWKTSIIFIHKMGKPLDSPASFRPISLTICVSKLFERIILSRLLFFLESNSILSPRQAGFRPGRYTLDQILCLSQSISNWFNKPRPGSRTILSTIDFSKAFDSVWHPALFHKLISAGLPPCFARWTRSFLSDKRACVIYQNHKSRSFRVRRDVPQGSVLGPVYFLSMIFRLLCLLSSAALFTLTIWPFGTPPLWFPLRWRPHKELCFDWSAGLSTGVFLSIRANVRPSSQWIPTKLTSSPTSSYSALAPVLIPLQLFLGSPSTALFPFLNMYLCLRPSFSHVSKALRCISASSWGPSKDFLSLLYKAFLRSLLTYASPGWFSFVSATNFTKLERLHRAASRAITCYLSSSPIPLFFSEASLPPLRVTVTQFTLSSYERALRLPTSFSISGLARLGVKPRLCRSSWRAFASTHPLMIASSSLREAFLACPPFPLGIYLPSLWSPLFPLHAPAPILLSLAKVRLSPTLTLSSLMIWHSGLAALFLFLLVMAASAYLPTALSVALRPLFSVQRVQYVQVFPLKPAPFCKLFAGLGSTNKSAISLLFFFYLTLVLSSPPCPLLHLSSYLNISGRNCLLFPPVLSGYSGSPDTRFPWGTTRLMSWSAKERYLRPPQSLAVSRLISRIHSCLFSDWRRAVSFKFFDAQVPSISTEELVLPRHARCVFSRLRCNGHSLLLDSYLTRIGRIENHCCSACEHSSQDTSHLILHCPATDSLRRALFGDFVSLYDLWSRRWGVARLLGLHGLPPCPRPLEGVG